MCFLSFNLMSVSLIFLIGTVAWQSEKQPYWSEYEDDRKPCSDQCYLRVWFLLFFSLKPYVLYCLMSWYCQNHWKCRLMKLVLITLWSIVLPYSQIFAFFIALWCCSLSQNLGFDVNLFVYMFSLIWLLYTVPICRSFRLL